MARIFINYRRGDSIATAGRLHDRLVRAFGRNNIFMDVDHIPVGVDFVKHLETQVGACEAFLAVIGQTWLETKDEAGRRRIDDPKDFVAIEIAAALERNIPVIPVLIDGACIPEADQLPEPLRPLARRHAIEIRNSQFGSDADRLIAKVREVIKPGIKAGHALALALAALFALGLAGWFGHLPFIAPVPTETTRTGDDGRVPANPTPVVAAAPPPSPDETKPSSAQLKLPSPGTYCDQMKRVIDAAPTRFESILGPKLGDNRMAKLPLPDWEDCIVYMEGRFTDNRRFNCSLSGFGDLQSAEKSAEDVAKSLKTDCLGPDWDVGRSFDTDGKRRTRLVGQNSSAKITLRPWRGPTDPSWSLHLDVE